MNGPSLRLELVQERPVRMTAEEYAELLADIYAPAPLPSGIERICKWFAEMDEQEAA